MESHISDGDETFEELDLHRSLVDVLLRGGFKRPSLLQQKVLSALLKGSSLILQSKSGTGKTVSYCIYILDYILRNQGAKRASITYCYKIKNEVPQGNISHFVESVVLTPTRELAIHVQSVISNLSQGLNTKVSHSVGGEDILDECKEFLLYPPNIFVSTPGRLRSMFKQFKRKRQPNGGNNFPFNNIWSFVSILVLDEADVLVEDQFIEQTELVCQKLVNPFLKLVAASATFLKPQFRHFEDVIYKCDEAYIERCNEVIKRHIRYCDDVAALPWSLLFHWHLYLSSDGADLNDGTAEEGDNKLDCIEKLLNFLKRKPRDFVKIIACASHVSRYDMKTLHTLSGGFSEAYHVDGEVCFVENEESYCIRNIMDRDVTQSNINSTPVLQEYINFYYVYVLDAPSIVSQISYKLNCLLTLLQLVKYRRCIIFCNQGHTRLQVLEVLLRYGFSVALTSARTSNQERNKFFKNVNTKEASVLICTDMISRGIDMENVDLIINMDIPKTKEIFLHRAGRTGRFGKKGTCISFVMKSEEETFDYIMYSLNFKCDPISLLLPRRDDLESYINDENVWIFDPFEQSHFMQKHLAEKVNTYNEISTLFATLPIQKDITLIEGTLDIDAKIGGDISRGIGYNDYVHPPSRGDLIYTLKMTHFYHWRMLGFNI